MDDLAVNSTAIVHAFAMVFHALDAGLRGINAHIRDI